MSEYRRSRAGGATFFFTVNSHGRVPVLTEPEVRSALRVAIAEVRREHPFVVHGWVLLPDHMHCIWELPVGDSEFGKRWGLIKSKVSKACRRRWTNKELSPSRAIRGEAALWQRRFWEHQIRDEEDLARHMDYLYWNPVKHRLVTQVKDWPYSTFHRHVRSGVYQSGWGMAERESPEGSYGE